jgi:hypothetical protein
MPDLQVSPLGWALLIVGGLVLGVIFGSVCLSFAVGVYNRFARRSGAATVPDPTVPKSMAIALAFVVANGLIDSLLTLAVGWPPAPSVWVGGAALSLAVAGAVLAALLPAKPGPSLLVSLLWGLVGCAVAGAIGAVAWLFRWFAGWTA